MCLTYLYCLPPLPVVFHLYSQIWLDVSGGFEAAIHATHYYIFQSASDSTLAFLKIDMKSAFHAAL